MTNIRFIYITCKDKEEAITIGRTLIKEKLAACVNIFDHMTSIYEWEGKLEESTEAVLIVKTSLDKIKDAERRVKLIHSYTCPCILSISIDEGNTEYLKWLENNLIQ